MHLRVLLGLLALAMALPACDDEPVAPGPETGDGVDPPPPIVDGPEGDPIQLRVERLFPASAPPDDAFGDCLFASPVHHPGSDTIIIGATETVRGIDPQTGAVRWSVTLPSPDDRLPMLVSTPALVPDPQRGRDLLVVAYHTSTNPAGRNVGGRKYTQLAAVIDVTAGALAEDFPLVVIDPVLPANEPGLTVPFLANHALSRSELIHAGATNGALGFVYVTYGNTRDVQPWHGFLFELDLDAWRTGGEPIRERFTTTPEADCGPPGQSGSTDRICGGGLWAPSGPLLIERGDSYELILAPGNGQTDLARRDYANSLMRVRPRESGLPFFEPQCDPAACADFNPDAPSTACLDSCVDLWLPHLVQADLPANLGRCTEDMTPWQCWEEMDYIGGSTPVHIPLDDGLEVLAYPAKDGAIYLVDALHMGRQYDREQLVATCGTPEDNCGLWWAGMIVTEPALTQVDGAPLVIVPTFMPDRTHAGGVVAVKVVMNGDTPQFEPYWTFPRFDTPEAGTRFRRHPSRPRLSTLRVGEQSVELVWVVEAKIGGRGQLVALDARTGAARVDETMAGPGMRFAQPLVVDDVVYVNSCGSDNGPGYLEAYRVVTD